MSSGYKTWPKSLPVRSIAKCHCRTSELMLEKRSQLFLAHGTADKVTSCKASETFFNSVVADDKKLSLYDVRPLRYVLQALALRMC